MSNKLTKAFLRWVIAPILRPIAYVVFDRRYIRGRYFDKQVIGWVWVFRSIVVQKLIGFNRSSPWPVSPLIRVSYPRSIVFDPDDLNNFQTFGCYFQGNANAKIIIGKGTYIAPNVGLITANHDPCNLDEYLPAEDIRLGKSCWIGMNSVIMPGVTLGDHTVVAAGSVVSHSFIEGNCIIGGVPAKFIKPLECHD
jgi:acetyltransferase-like isoleucine patch superfamily enzyme